MHLQRVSAPFLVMLRRVAGALGLLAIVVTITFLLVRLAPGDAASLLVPPGASAADAARLRPAVGLDQPMVVQYARWWNSLLHGDLGESFAMRRPVTTLLGETLPVSLGLG